MTGRLSDLGTAGRNGVLLAVNEINEKGGIKGRHLKLIIKDDQHDTETAKKVDLELIEEGAEVIIGHMTSTISYDVQDIINNKKIVMVSPTASTRMLSGKDDYFFRIMPELSTSTDYWADYLIRILKITSVSCIYDLSNETYTKNWYDNFASSYVRSGGEIIKTVTFSSGGNISYLDLSKSLLTDETGGIMIIASAIDTAMISQQVRKLGSSIPLYACGWAYTSDLIRYGGPSVENIIITHSYNKESKEPAFIEFSEKYFNAYGSKPDFASSYSYEAMLLIAHVLEKKTAVEKPGPEDFKNIVLKGLQSDIITDEFGDAKRQPFLFTIKKGHFVLLNY